MTSPSSRNLSMIRYNLRQKKEELIDIGYNINQHCRNNQKDKAFQIIKQGDINKIQEYTQSIRVYMLTLIDLDQETNASIKQLSSKYLHIITRQECNNIIEEIKNILFDIDRITESISRSILATILFESNIYEE